MRQTLILAFLFAHVAIFANNKLDIIAKIPSQLLPGKSYNVEIIINKGDLTSYAYFEHDLPAGIEAEEAINDNSDFTFEAGKVRFVWMRLPEKQRLKVVYKINVPSDTTGFFDITGRFSYIIKNQRGEVDLTPTKIGIGSEADLAKIPMKLEPSLQKASVGITKPQINVKREEPDYMDFDKSYSVILLIKKDSMKTSLKIEETLPDGFVPKPLKTSGAKFSVDKNIATFEWDSLPQVPYFTVSYLAKGENFTPQMTFDVGGKFSYNYGSKTYSFYIDKNYGADYKKPSLEQLRKKKFFMQVDTSKYKVKRSAIKDTVNKLYYNNKLAEPDKKKPKNSINEIKSMFN